MKRAAFAFPLVLLFALITVPVHAQWDTGSSPDKGAVYNPTFVSGDCTMDMTPDQCMAAGGTAGGMKTCTANNCLQCGRDAFTAQAVCVTVNQMNGSCECTVSDSTANGVTTRTCSGSGKCTYTP